MSQLTQKHQVYLDSAIKHLDDLVEIAQGNKSKNNTCGLSKDTCKNAELWVSTWVLPYIRAVRNNITL